MASEKTVNYTAEQTSELVKLYEAGTDVEQLAERFGKTARSVIAKLSREGVYQSKAKATAGKKATKAELVAMLEKHLEAEKGALESLEKATKEALEMVVSAFDEQATPGE